MSKLAADFDEYLRILRSNIEEPSLDYWADLVFLMQAHPSPLVEKRFRGGLLIWLLWILCKILRQKNQSSSDLVSINSNIPVNGFRLLPTPAHLDSLTPLLAEEEYPESAITFGHSMGLDANQMHVPLGLPESLARLSVPEKLSALGRALSQAYGIFKTLSKSHFTRAIPKNGFKARVVEQLFTYELEIQHLRRSGISLSSLFLTYELSAESKGLIAWANESGIRIVHVMHGQRFPTFQITRATDLVLLSRIDEPWFRARIPSDVKIWTIGHPRLEKIRREVPAPLSPHSHTSLPRIAFFSQPFELNYCQKERQSDWELLAGLKGRAEVRFRMHPREDKQQALQDLQKINADFIELSDEGLKEDLQWCDAVASSWSTVSMEAAACGRGIFWTCSTPEKYEASQELRDHGIGTLIQNHGDWEDHLAAWDRGGWEAPVIVATERLVELGMIGDMDTPWLERLGLASSLK
jgi:hypothetical protein